MKPEVAVVIDTETGSTDIHKAGICQVAGVVVSAKSQRITTLMSTYCKPSIQMEEGAVAVHGITEDMYRYSPPESWALAALDLYLEKLAKSYTVYLAGHNIDRYDLPLIKLRYPQGSWDSYKTIDTLRWARRRYHDVDHKLEPLYVELIKKPALEAHDAAADCHMGAEVLSYMLNSEGITMEVIANSLAKPRFYEFMPFGKYKGAALGTDVPESYLLWMQKNFHDPDPDLKETLRYYLNDFAKEKAETTYHSPELI